MRNVTISENGVARADARDFAIPRRAVDGDIFTKRIVIADLRARDSAFPFQVLRLQSDARERKNFISLTQLCVAINDNVRWSLQLSPSTTFSPMTQYGPISQPLPTCAFEWITAEE